MESSTSRSLRQGHAVNKMVNFLGMTLGGYVGWYLGEPVSFFTAFMLSMVGTGLGLWGAHWAVRRYF
jgi:hypothetical protein